ncbi:hypothetical protein Lalb_Chr16g0389841 [Lupinus albus]|uniref:Uncharacterized protein n=1 Tax=Lupinus albus TaxID=3870 RepID=A0A6A4NYX1_LUPAL|nr:hypothetical protein Lalb_Chr16g0389841 [Lupinus albus]
MNFSSCDSEVFTYFTLSRILLIKSCSDPNKSFATLLKVRAMQLPTSKRPLRICEFFTNSNGLRFSRATSFDACLQVTENSLPSRLQSETQAATAWLSAESESGYGSIITLRILLCNFQSLSTKCPVINT